MVLSTIDYDPNGDITATATDGGAGDSPLVNIDYRRNPNGRIFIAQIEWGNTGQLVEIQLDREGITRSITYSQPTLFVDYGTDPIGRIQRRSIIATPQYFDGNSSGYVTLISRDNDGRPSTMRITDRTSGNLLYLLAVTYSPNGEREVETYQYGENVAVTISSDYTFDVGGISTERNQLHFQTIDIADRGTFTYEYHYSTVGNLDRITQVVSDDTAEENVCVQFTYDGFNRLIAYEASNGITQTLYL